LGRIPDNIGSVSNLLLFNTNEYVYKEYETLWNPLEGQDIRELPTEQQLNIDPPPNSLLKEDFMEFDVQKINFRPKIKDLPQFSLPQQLDLPDVIETTWDSNFSSISSIAPSGVLELLPTVDTKGDSSGGPQSGGSMDNAPPPPPPPGADSSSVPPPPPPPPSKSSLIDPPVVGAPNGVAPPPPPPPSGNKPNIPTLDVPDVPDGGRSDLLASIRSFKMGNLGDKKRNITQRPPPKESAKVVAPAENFMSALMRTMSVRRMAIEGKKDSMSSEPRNTEVETIKRPDEMKIPERKVEQKVEQSEDLPPLETIPEKVPEKKATDLLDDWSASDEEDF
jgi:WAS protein family homolog 1